jgi:2-hydroxychromene-2-carboxylate isomerase
MADDSNVDFYFDPTCGWAWRTSIWMRRIAAERGLKVTWRPFSLAVVNAPDDYTKDSPGHVLGVPLERALVLARRKAGNEGVDRLYVAQGNVYHGDMAREGFLEPAVQAGCLERAGLPPSLYDEALKDPSTEAEIISDTKAAAEKRGVFGVPTLAFADTQFGFFGPVVNKVPNAEESVALWEMVKIALRQPHLFEMKRNRTRETQYAPNQYAD